MPSRRFAEWLSFACFGACWLVVTAVNAQLPSFPGAEGEGRFVTGGRGGDVYHVTTLNDSGVGSLRHGLATAFNGPRTIVFDVGGTIDLNSDLNLNNANITIAGETAPGKGVVITNYGLGVNAPNVIIRHLRVRPGDRKKGSSGENGFNGDAISINRSDVILDHVSASWGIDENLSVAGNGTRRVTIQYSTISEGLAQTGLYHGEWDPNYNPGGSDSHSMGSLIKPGDGNGIISMHHNLWSNNGNRNPALGNYSDDHTLRVDLRNNVMYNNRSNGYSSGESARIDLNYVGNYVIAGPNTSSGSRMVGFRAAAANNMRIYSAGNLVDGNRNARLDGVVPPASFIQGEFEAATSPFSLAPVTTASALQAFDQIVAEAGAFYWNRDAVDARLITELTSQRGQIVNSQGQVGGYPTLPVVARPLSWDADGDGMPDAWEKRTAGLNPNLADNNGDVNVDGYTNLEEYLHFCATGLSVPEPTVATLIATMISTLALLNRDVASGGRRRTVGFVPPTIPADDGRGEC